MTDERKDDRYNKWCPECPGKMQEVGTVGNTSTCDDGCCGGESIQVWQCPKCKTIKITP